MDERPYHLPIHGMTCAHCEQTVAAALQHAGATTAQADFRRGTAWGTLPPAVAPAALVAAVQAAGYTPGAVQVDPPAQPAVPPQVQPATRRPAAAYDLAIIGSGGAAMAAAITATQQQARIIMVERGTLGGTCVNIGCVPSKTLLRASELYAQAHHPPFAGIATQAGVVNLGALVAQKDALVGDLRQAKYADLIAEYGWELVPGAAHFLDAETLAVGDRRIQAAQYLLATGADPAVPAIPGLAEAGYLTSTSALALTTLPESLLIIGAGYIALELGQLFHRLGTRVTLVQRGPALLPAYEPEIGAALAAILAAQGITVITEAQVAAVTRDGAGRQVHLRVRGESQMHPVSQVLVATGRQPNTGALNLAAAGVAVDARGAVQVDAYLRTTNPRIWAAGDVTLGPQFVYVAAYEGKLVAENALAGADRTVDFTAVPQVVFTQPQIAVVGQTEAAARAHGVGVKTSVLPLEAVPRARVNHDTAGMIKIVADAAGGRILGVQILAENAGEVIYAATLAVKFGLTITDLVESFAPYLTMAEGLKLAAQSFAGGVEHLSCCAA